MSRKARNVVIPAGPLKLQGIWAVPAQARGVVLFAHGSGSSRLSPRNQEVAEYLQDAGFATLLMDLLCEEEAEDRANVFDIDLLASRLIGAIDWIENQADTRGLPIGLFGASTGSAAALTAAAQRPEQVRTVISRGGRPDLAWKQLSDVKADTLLIVGSLDHEVLLLNRKAQRRLGAKATLEIVPGATHLFEEPGAMRQVCELARNWFERHLQCPDSVACDFDPVAGVPGCDGFRDRADAAQQLAARLHGRRFERPLILAIPRGGVVLGAIVADALDAEFDVVLSRKLRMPANPEFAIGAVAENGEVYYNLSPDQMSRGFTEFVRSEREHELAEIARRRVLFRQGRPAAEVKGRSVIVVDDGIATGSTMIAALRTLRLQKPHELIVAVPVAAPDRLAEVRQECDEVVCLIEAPDLHAVGEFYDDFTQVEDDEVVALLNRQVSRA